MGLTRRDFLKLTCAAAATAALGGGLASLSASCSGPATATTAASTTTTAASTTTVSVEPSAALIGQSLVLKDLRPADLPLGISAGTVLTAIDPSAKAANALYKRMQPNYDVLYAAPANRVKDDGRGDLNAVVVSQPIRYDKSSPGFPAQVLDFLGGSLAGPVDTGGKVLRAGGVVRGAYVVGGDIVVVLENPLTAELMQARLLVTVDPNSEFADYGSSRILVRDLKKDVIHFPFNTVEVPDANQFLDHFLKWHTLSEVVQPGDIGYFNLVGTTKDDIQVAGDMIVERFDGGGSG